MSINPELIGLLRTVINDWDDCPRYSDSRLSQVIVAAANYVLFDTGLTTYTSNLTNLVITPDPTTDNTFSNLLILKANCLIDSWEARGAARKSGVSFQEFASKVDTKGVADAWLKLLTLGACKTYDDSLFDYMFSDGTIGYSIMTPFRTYYSSAFNCSHLRQ